MRYLTSAALVLAALLAGAAPAAGDVTLSIRDGRVILFAQDATLGQILAEWERIGNTKIVNREKLPARRVTLALADETESQALAVLLRSLGGYVAVRRATTEPGVSVFDRIIILNGEVPASAFVASSAQPAANPSQQPDIRGQLQQRVLADGRVISFIENPDRPGEISVVGGDPDGDPASGAEAQPVGRPTTEVVNPDPLVGPGGRGLQIRPGSGLSMTGPGQAGVASGGQMSADPFNLQSPVSMPAPGAAPAPTAPGAAPKPGVVVPGQKPPGPPKGPGGEGS